MFRWGILSSAKIAREQLIPAIAASQNGVVAAIASRDGGRAEEVARQYAIPLALGSYDELLSRDDIDGIYIPLPTAQHVEWTLKAIEAGKHVLCEKPIALNAGDIEPLIAARDAAGVTVAEAFMVQHHPQWAKTRALIAGGAIGTLRHVQAAFSYHNVDPSNMRNRPELGGGALPDIGVYPTVVTRLVTGAEPLEATARVVRDPAFGTDTYADCRLRFPDFDCSFYVATQMAARQSMVFHGSDGFIEIETPFNVGSYGHPVLRLEDQAHGRAEVFRFGKTDQYRLQVEAFVRRARGEDAPVFTLEDSVANQRVIDALYRAGESGGWESV
ncbi:Gfo/Idh/MocA family oxidoreductase [Aurantimonas sp. MSK8Z-1]|uniref:Gfo/Idh/MocA family protein n=1 Tax=Mangrovibrevibacter kandeliae TaxID=2968473 RepID=UPI0021194B72|nr:Gfo/Idh/MocA family oxidoreductase [Aurantimonas sp. MSK8Z-1]MCW4115766.1 Gfo/Idh/MocA family oxidoreductase [Aurantimonas sp. MSK8Z-1]